MKKIDPHCHCRDGIRRVTEIFRDLGFGAILDMAMVFTEKEARERIALAEMRQSVIPYFFYLRLTADEKQIAEAVRVVNTYPQVVGLKLKDVSRETELRRIYKTLASQNYQGVLAVHCEKDELFQPELFDPERPWTHNLAQPPEAEIESVEDQIIFALDAGFKGNLHICHISCPQSVDLVWEMKSELNITSEITPHHALLTSEWLKKEPEGLLYKVDPPLRDAQTVKEMQKRLLKGKIDCIGTDFAHHTLEEKLNPPYSSGIAWPQLYPDLLSWLSQRGMSEAEIENLTYWNIKRVFGEKLSSV